MNYSFSFFAGGDAPLSSMSGTLVLALALGVLMLALWSSWTSRSSYPLAPAGALALCTHVLVDPLWRDLLFIAVPEISFVLRNIELAVVLTALPTAWFAWHMHSAAPSVKACPGRSLTSAA